MSWTLRSKTATRFWQLISPTANVGFDVKPFAPVFERGSAGGLHVTVHSGEADYPESAGIRALGRSSTSVPNESATVCRLPNLPRLSSFVRENRVPLELCPTSNRLTNAVKSIAEHPFRRLMESGILVTLNSDDPGIFDIDLTHEYAELSRHQAFSEKEFDRINDIAAAASFLPLDEKQKHWPRAIDPDLAPLSK